MPSETEFELYRRHGAAQERYTYFMLAGAGAAIAFAVTRTQDLALSYSQVPLALAVLAWGGSFFAGCMNLRYVVATLYGNMALLNVQSGTHPKVGANPQVMQAASEGIRDAIETNSNRASAYARWQFSLLIAGAVFFVAWDILEMYLRTNP